MRWLFVHHFFQGFGEALFFTVASALFLAQFAVTELPFVFLVAAAALLVVGRVYARLEHALPLRRLLPGVVLTLVVLVLLAWAGLTLSGAAAMAFGLVVVHRIIYLLTNLEFWGVSALLLDVRQGKRLFGLISAGDIPAKLLGYLVVAALGPTVGLPNLLLLAAISFGASLPVLTRLLQSPALAAAEDHSRAGHSAAAGADHPAVAPVGSALLRLFGSPFIAALAGLSFAAVVGFTCIDFAFLEGAQQRYGGAGRATELAHFLGLFLGFGKALTIVTKLFFSGRIVERLGVKRALLLPPALLLALALGTLAATALGVGSQPLFWLFGALVLVAQIFKYTLHDPIFLALFQPLNHQLRLHGHTTVKGIVDPLALGAAGALLLAMLWLRGFIEPTDINRVLLVLLLGWLALVVVVSRQYVATLSSAIRRRFLEGSQVVISDRAAAAVVEEKLASPHPEEVIYAIELLVKSQPPALLATRLSALLQHPAEAVRRQVLEKLDAATLLAARPAVLALAANPAEVPAVRAAAVGAFSHLADETSTAQALPYLHDPDPGVRQAAITGLLRSGGLEAVVLAGQQLLHLVEAPAPAARALAAQIIGELGVRNFYQPIAALLQDADPEVRRAAITAAGRLANERLLAPVLALLPDLTVREEVVRALTGFGDPALPALAACLRRADSLPLALAALLVMGRIGSPAAIGHLTALLTATPAADLRLRRAALRALRGAGYQAPRGVVADALLTLLDEQIAHAVWCLRGAEALGAADARVSAAADSTARISLRPALLEEATTAYDRLFRLLGLLYEPRTVLKVRAGLESGRREPAANALEILDHLLPQRQSAALALLLEPLAVAEKLRLLAPYVPPPAQTLAAATIRTAVLTAAAGRFHRWTLAVALQSASVDAAAAALDDTAADPLLAPYLHHADPLLRQTATVAHRRAASDFAYSSSLMSHSAASNPAAGTLLEIEKVVVLKSTSIFADTPEHILVDVAAIVREERCAAGQVIFQQGALGDAMYVIYQGDVRIHAGATTFATLHNRDIFGELALLDPEPRSASATALTDSLLLRLEQEAFFELMAERREVAQGILRMLTRRLRAQNQLLAARPQSA